MVSQKNYNYLIDLIGGVWIENNGTQHLKIKDKPYDITFNPRVLFPQTALDAWAPYYDRFPEYFEGHLFRNKHDRVPVS